MFSLYIFLRTLTMNDQGSPIEEDARNPIRMRYEFFPSEKAVEYQSRIWQCARLNSRCWRVSVVKLLSLEGCM